MIFDYNLMVADDLAHDGTPTAIDLGVTSPGKGRQMKVFVQGHSLAGATGVVLTDGATSSAADAYMTITCAVAVINAGMEITLSSDVQRYLKIDLVGTTTAGTWSAGLILDNGQTNV